MKKIITFSLAAILLSACSSVANDTPDDFAKSAVDCLKNNDFNSFEELIITEDDFAEIAEKAGITTEKDREEANARAKERIAEITQLLKERFDRFHDGKMEFVSSKSFIQKENGFEFIQELHVTGTIGKEPLLVVFKELVKTSDGWKLLGSFDVTIGVTVPVEVNF